MSKPRVLVVDDDPGVLGLVSKALSLRGYEIQAVSHPYEALKLAHDKQCFDLVLSDVLMPDMCGTELVKHILRQCPEAAVVIMSGHVDYQAVPVAAAFLSKPFAVNELYSVVEKALGSSESSNGVAEN